MLIDKELIDSLTEQAKTSPRLRMNYDLRNSAEDNSQRMLNALEPGTVMPIHRHQKSSETVVILRGRIRWDFYDDNGNITESATLDANGDLRCLNVEKGRWHSLECLESDSVLFESKDGAYEPLSTDDIKKENDCKHDTNMDKKVLIERLKEFIEAEGRSCSMDISGITPEYVSRMWGGSVPVEDIAEALDVVIKQVRSDR